jgi:titin
MCYKLYWTDNSRNEEGFEIERAVCGQSNWTLVTTTDRNVTRYTDCDVLPFTAYQYRVHAINPAGFSANSNVAVVLLAAPSSLDAVLGNNTVDLSWTSNGFSQVSYKIVRSTDGVNFQPLASVFGEQISYADTTIGTSGTYFYRLYGYNACGISGYSNMAIVSYTLPAAPSMLTGSWAIGFGGFVVNLQWQNNSNNSSGFELYRSDSGGPYTLVDSNIAWNAVSTITGGVFENVVYKYRIRAVNNMGASGYSNEVTIVISNTPTDPSNLIATAISSSQINLNWADNSSNETGFSIESAPVGTGGFVQIATVGADVTTYSNTGLSAGTSLQYRVMAYNGSGNSGYTNIATATTFPALPSTPSNLTASAISSSQINLSWTDNASNESGFNIERAPSGGSFIQIASVGANVTTYSNTGLTAGTTYQYRVRAYNTGGNSTYSNTASATTFTATPNAPSNLTATSASRTQINLSWTDNASNESGFNIERAPSGGSFSQIASVGANVTGYSNTGLTAGTTYQYRVRAYNASGNSGYSNTASTATHSNLATSGTASASSSQSGNPASNARDNSTTTRWCASSSSMSQWWKVDLGASKTLSEVEIMFQYAGASGDCNDFTVETSPDNSTWTNRVNRSTNTNTAQTQAYTFSATARYVRITINDAPGANWASMFELRVFGK